MMEEVSDDTNGESTFEFVRKVDENILKEDEAIESKVAPPIPESFLSSFSSHQNAVNMPIFVPVEKTAEVASITTKTEVSSINSPQYASPPITNFPKASVMDSPIEYTQNQYSSVQQNIPPAAFAQYVEQPLSSQPPYSQVLIPDCAIPVLSTWDNAPLKLEESHDAGVWGWIKGSQLLNRVAEKAKNSVDSVITTLDPGMKEIINSGGDISVVVASSNEAKISAVREAFQMVFGKATVQGMPAQSSSIAPQPVGFSAGLKAAEERINNLRQHSFIQQDHIILAVENFITELTPENWFDMGCLLLQDFNTGTTLQVYTEAVPVSSHFVQQAKDQTPTDYPLGWSGYAVTMGQIIGPALGVHHSEWHQALTGVSRREILFLASKTIAGLYKTHMRR